MKIINTFDIDGVIFMGDYNGVYPSKDDVIITGRSVDEYEETMAMLRSKGIDNEVFMNPTPFDKKTREGSGIHKATIIKFLEEQRGVQVGVHFEDDSVQMNEIIKRCPNVNVVHLVHNLVEKENVRRPFES